MHLEFQAIGRQAQIAFEKLRGQPPVRKFRDSAAMLRFLADISSGGERWDVSCPVVSGITQWFDRAFISVDVKITGPRILITFRDGTPGYIKGEIRLS